MSIESINATGDCVSVCQAAQRRLNRLADAFAMTGNDRVANELEDIGGIIVEAAIAAQRAQSKSLSNDLREANEFTGRMLSGLLHRGAEA